MTGQNMNIKYEGYDFNITAKNPLFSEAKIYVMYHGDNRNNTHISKRSVDRAIESIYNIPIVGEFVESDEGDSNFGSHGGQVVIDDDGIKFIHTTKPIGVVPESARIHWEVVEDQKGREREYLVVDGALVWNRYEDEVNTLKEDNFGQSMEIEVEDGVFDEDRGIYDIKDFIFSALCVLGIDGRKDGKVEPAFEDSKIVTYSKEEFSSELKEMKEELKQYFTSYSKEEERALKDEDKKFEDEHKDEELTEKEKPQTQVTADDEENKQEEPEIVQTNEEGIAGDKIEDEEQAEKRQGTSGDTTGADTTGGDARAIADANTTGTITTDTVDTADTASEAEAIAEANTDDDYAKKYEELKNEFDTIKEELEGLRDFKAEVDKENHEKQAVEVFEKLGLGEEDIKDIDIYAHSIEELEEKGYAILGRKMAEGKSEFALADEGTATTNKVGLSQASAESKTSRYGNLFKKYGDK